MMVGCYVNWSRAFFSVVGWLFRLIDFVSLFALFEKRLSGRLVVVAQGQKNWDMLLSEKPPVLFHVCLFIFWFNKKSKNLNTSLSGLLIFPYFLRIK